VRPPRYYILDDAGEPKPVDIETWAPWFDASVTDRRSVIAQDRDEGPDRVEILVSTVFLGIDHSFGSNAFQPHAPVLWETLVMGGLLDGEMDRYTSRAAALAGHQAMCRRVADSIALQQKEKP